MARRKLSQRQASSFRAERLGYDPTLMQAALDQVDSGFVLLDRDLSSRFINRAFRHIWQLPNEKADSGPTFAELVQHGRDTKAYAVPSGQIDAYVSRRIELVAAGNVPRLDLCLSGDRVVRLECKPLPDGARVLTYFDVTGMIPKTPASEATDSFLTQAPLPAHMQPGGPGASAVSWQVRRTEQFIEVNWDQPLTMDEIASAVGASKRSIFRAFQRARGYSPKAFVKQVRLRCARDLLESANASTTVTDVAFNCGFNDVSHFSRDYRRNFEELPSRALQCARVE